MQGEVIRLRPSTDEDAAQGQSAPAGQISDYILDMVEQLAALAGQNGEPVLAAMLNEVARRHKPLSPAALKPSQTAP